MSTETRDFLLKIRFIVLGTIALIVGVVLGAWITESVMTWMA